MWWKGGSTAKPESWLCCDDDMISTFLSLQWCNDTKVENAKLDLSIWNPSARGPLQPMKRGKLQAYKETATMPETPDGLI